VIIPTSTKRLSSPLLQSQICGTGAASSCNILLQLENHAVLVPGRIKKIICFKNHIYCMPVKAKSKKKQAGSLLKISIYFEMFFIG
jgi:hypothetical protein